MDQVARAAGIEQWPTRPSNPAMEVHLSDGRRVRRLTGPDRWEERRAQFGNEAQSFWEWQEKTADALWDFALRNPTWPPQTPSEAGALGAKTSSWLWEDWRNRLSPRLAADAFRSVGHHLKGQSPALRQFIDGQLLIAAQATSRSTNALYGASALDLPRRGVVHLEGGMGGIAKTLAEAVQANGGRVLYRQEVVRVRTENGKPAAVITKHGREYPADQVIFNLPPWNIARLLEDFEPRRLKNLPEKPVDGWGAFMVYLGVDSNLFSTQKTLHHQVIAGEELAEGRSIFISVSPSWDTNRAPNGRRAVTISTHTDLAEWWKLFEADKSAYDAKKSEYVEKMLRLAERVFPELRAAVDLVLPGTPVTFNRFTRRDFGWVGGFPQTNLFRAWGPRLSDGLWMVGDSIFPGQSTAAVALGGLRVADSVLQQMGMMPDPAPAGHSLAAPSQVIPRQTHSARRS
jgi:phytoene dehydrogenase-like protein